MRIPAPVSLALRRLLPPLVLLAVLLAVWFTLKDRLLGAEAEMGIGTVKAISYAIQVALWMSGAWLAARLLDLVLWELLLVKRFGGRPAPAVLRALLTILLFAVAIGAIIGVVFDKSLTGLWATSGVFGIVLGFALRDIIADFFAGLAVNLDRSYEIGDWVEVHYRHLREPIYGRVVEINWRTTRIELDTRNVVVLPNNVMGTAVIINFSSPPHPARLEAPVTLDLAVPTERAMRVLHAGASSAAGRAGLLADPPPHVIVGRVTPLGIEYLIRFWIDAHQITPPQARSMILAGVLDHLDRAGLTPAIPKQDMFVARMPVRQLMHESEEDRVALLSKVELFAEALSEEERVTLARDMHLALYKPGETLIRQGEAGQSMFVLAEGLLHVEALDASGRQARVNQLRPGQVFGEMSLLTGEPRTATVIADMNAAVFEITKGAFAPILAARPAVAEALSAVMATRRLGLTEAFRAAAPEAVREEATTLSRNILGAMRRFFGL